MKILKYGLFFLLIGFVGGLLYLATIDRNYKIQKTMLTNVPIEVVFEVVNDYKTWENWAVLDTSESNVLFSFSAQTAGVEATFSWKSAKGSGTLKNAASIENKSIHEIANIEGIGIVDGIWQFKKAPDGVEITREIRGKLPFLSRFTDAKMTAKLETMVEKSLSMLAVYLQHELKKFSIESVGEVNYSGSYYVYQITSCQFQDIPYKTNELIAILTTFLKTHNIVAHGKPFNLYHKRDELFKTTIFATGIPIQNQLILTDKTIMDAILPQQRAFKTVLKGDYSNIAVAWETAYKNLETAGFKVKENGIPFEVFVTNPKEVPNPAKWITEIYIPIEDEIKIDN